ncbi:hypothetical protein TNCV_3224651 [Trichonephila clavipes]|nr:hypothetical protein TNCV_3224651 [Trichonephila clavipes]
MRDLRSSSRVLRPRQFQEIKRGHQVFALAPRKEPEDEGLGDRSSSKLSSLWDAWISMTSSSMSWGFLERFDLFFLIS